MKTTHIQYQGRVRGSSMLIPGETLNEVKTKIKEYSHKNPSWKFIIEKVTTIYEELPLENPWKLGDEFKLLKETEVGEQPGDICRVIGFDPDGVAVHYSNLTRDLNEKFLPDSPFAKTLIERI